MTASRQARLAVTLAAIAGFVDAACYLTLHQLFVAHVTGDANLLGQRLGRGDLAGAVPLGVAIAGFAVSITLATVGLELATRMRLPSPLALALGAEAILLGFVMGYGATLIHHGTIRGRSIGGYYVLLCSAVAAVGLQTAAFTKCGERTVRTTYISGMTTRLAQALANILLPPPGRSSPSYVRDSLRLPDRRESLEGAFLYGALILAFVAGACLAVYLVLRIDLWALAAPIAALVALAAAVGWGAIRHLDTAPRPSA